MRKMKTQTLSCWFSKYMTVLFKYCKQKIFDVCMYFSTTLPLSPAPITITVPLLDMLICHLWLSVTVKCPSTEVTRVIYVARRQQLKTRMTYIQSLAQEIIWYTQIIVTFVRLKITWYQWRTEGEEFGVFKPPLPNSEVLTKSNRIAKWAENV